MRGESKRTVRAFAAAAAVLGLGVSFAAVAVAGWVISLIW